MLLGRWVVRLRLTVKRTNRNGCPWGKIRREPAVKRGQIVVLSFPIDDPALGEIVGRQFHANFVAWNDPDKVLSHSSGHMSHHFAAGFELNTKPRIGERLGHGALDLERFFFGTHALTLAELDATTGTTKTRLLSFLHSAVPSQETAVSHMIKHALVVSAQRPCQTHPDRATLAGHAAAIDADQHIDLVGQFGGLERLNDRGLMLIVDEIFFHRFAVDGDFTAAGTHANASDAALSATGAEGITADFVFLDCNHRSLVSELEFFGNED